MVTSSGALIVKDVRPGDDGVYSCEAKNVLSSINVTAKLTVQCKLLYLSKFYEPSFKGNSICRTAS